MSSLLLRSDVMDYRRRYRGIVFLVVLAFTGLIGRLVQLQIVEGDQHRAQARKNIVRTRTLNTTRGVIRDAHGQVLAGSRPSYNAYVVPEQIDMKETWPRVAQLMGLTDAERVEMEAKILGVQNSRRANQQTLLKVDLRREVVAVLETHEDQLEGVEVSPQAVRYYPYGELGAHIVGYMREVDAESLARLEGRGYRSGDRLGAVGVERRWESYLRGQRGWKKYVRKANKRRDREAIEKRYLEEPRRLEPVPGRDISLTFDIELEQSVERAMRGQLGGAVVVADVRTGRILAALSKPSFNPEVASGSKGKQAVRDAYKRLTNGPLKPRLDKTISAAYPPGSTYKPFSALAALAKRKMRAHDEVDCRGGYEFGKRYFRCTGVHRGVNLHEAIVQSCNTYFYQLGEAMRIDDLAEVGMDFGFGTKTGIGINPEARGRMPTRSWYTRRYKGQYRGGFKLLAAIGQGATTVTVLQLALAYAAIANGGTLYQPQVVRSIETSNGTVVQDFPPRVRRIVNVDPDRLSAIRSALTEVVTTRKGTAYKEHIDGVDMAGKTGTAEVSRVSAKTVDPGRVWYFNRDHAWFSGYAPAVSPEIAIVVLIEHGGAGGKNAVPVAMRVVRDWQQLRARRRAERADKKKSDSL